METSIADESEQAAEPTEDAPPPRNWRDLVTPRNVIGSILLAVFFVVGLSFVVLSQNPGVKIDCDELKTQGVTESGQILAAQLESDMSELDLQRAAVVKRIGATTTAVDDLKERRELAATPTTTVSGQSPETPPIETPPIETPPIETPPIETPPIETPQTAGAEAAAEESAAQLDNEFLTQIQALQAEITQLESDLERLDLEKTNQEAARGGRLQRAAATTTPRSTPHLRQR